MEVFRQVSPLRSHLKNLRCERKQLGFVPTMGALHQGHLALLEASRKTNDITICSIFINPTQFNNQEDFLKYPRNFTEDFRLLESEGCDVIFCPDEQEIYREPPRIRFDFGNLDTIMEGRFRPGHFNGVAQVVSRLFNIVQPDYAYFGQKDLQQFMIIDRLVRDLLFDLKLVRIPTIREPDGLAMSSRNLRLNDSERKKAVIFHQALKEAEINLKQQHNVSNTKSLVESILAEEPAVSLEYFEVVDEKTLELLKNEAKPQGKIALCIAGQLGPVRLIDNLITEL